MEDKRGGRMELPGVLQIMSETVEHDLIYILWQVVLLCLCFMYDLNQSHYACIVVTPRLARASKITDTRKRPGCSTVVMLTRACWFTELKPVVIYHSASYTFLKYYSYIFFTRLWELGRINILHLILLERCVDHNRGAFTRVLDSCYIRQLGIRLPLYNAGPLWKDAWTPRFDYFIL